MTNVMILVHFARHYAVFHKIRDENLLTIDNLDYHLALVVAQLWLKLTKYLEYCTRIY